MRAQAGTRPTDRLGAFERSAARSAAKEDVATVANGLLVLELEVALEVARSADVDVDVVEEVEKEKVEVEDAADEEHVGDVERISEDGVYVAAGMS
jgi:hypothetical protein